MEGISKAEKQVGEKNDGYENRTPSCEACNVDDLFLSDVLKKRPVKLHRWLKLLVKRLTFSKV